MIGAFLRSAESQRTLRVSALLLVLATASRTTMGVSLGILLYTTPDPADSLLLVALFCLGLFGHHQCRDAMEYRLAKLTESFASRQQRRVVGHLLASDPVAMEAFGAGKIAAQLEQLTRFLGMFDRVFGGLITFAATFVSILIVALVRNPVSFLVAVGVVGAAGLCYAANRHFLARRGIELGDSLRMYRDGVADLVLGFKEFKLNPARANWYRRSVLRPVSQRLGQARAAFETTSGLNQAFVETLALLAAGSIAAASASITPDDRLSAGIIAISIILLPTASLRALPDFLQLRALLRGLDETLASLPPEVKPLRKEWLEPVAEFQSLRLVDAILRPGADRFVLGPVSCDFQRGTINFVTGANGSGKSTLMRILCGLTPPESGTALLNGRETWLPAQRHLFSTVFAEVHLFDRLYGMSAEAGAEVNAWLARLGIAHITRVRDGRFTKLDLSTGQRKRVALAVALAERRPVLLLDEWAADQDPKSRHMFYRELLPELRAEGRTIIAISHDDRYFDAADHLIHLDSGQMGEITAEKSCFLIRDE
jgi:putative ATP-binding cassette transporter